MQIRRYREKDTPAVRRLHPTEPPLSEAIQLGGDAWVALEQGQLIGYVRVLPLPGLPQTLDLQICVARKWRRRGVGSRLLASLLDALSGPDLRTVSVGLDSLDEPTAHFLRARHFYLEHEEWQMALEPLSDRPPLPPSPSCHLHTYPRQQAIEHFLRLYEAAFSHTPWYQPYSRSEVASELQQARDLLFLLCEQTVVGFAWVHRHANVAEIEPMGILPDHRRRGLGRLLLLKLLQRLQDQRLQRVQLGVWRENAPAIALYRNAGFKRYGRRFYLAYDLQETKG